MNPLLRGFLAAIAVMPLLLFGQQSLDNESIIKMSKAGLSEEVIVGSIKNQPGKYAVGADELIALKQAGVSDKVIAAIVSKGASGPSTSVIASKAGGELMPDIPGAGVVTEIGVYVKRNDKWEEVVPDPVNWKTGGAIKSGTTLGVIKKDMNGHIAGAHSRNIVKMPVEFLIFTREGESYGEYQLLRLRENKTFREFRFVTGGIFNQKGGAQRDLLSFEAKKIAPRTYHVVLTDRMDYGEYGFLPPNTLSTTNPSAQLGKIYTFRIPD